MKAAVVHAFDHAPQYEDVPDPHPTGEHAMVVEVLAAGLHPRVRSQAAGSHYTSTEELPLVPGIDGVGRDPEGALRYFVLPDTTLGAMAQRTVIDRRRSVVLDPGSDPVALAAAMNPAMSSWVALRRRTSVTAGARVLVLGATGNAGRLAIGVARMLGAGEVIAAGRDPERLAELPTLGASATVSLAGEAAAVAQALAGVAANVEIVLDYLWGEPAAAAMAAIVTARSDHSSPVTWIEIGAVAGATAPIPAAALRAARLQLVGSGQGSVPTADILAELPELARRITAGALTVNARAVPLADVERAWADTRSAQRIVLVP